MTMSPGYAATGLEVEQFDHVYGTSLRSYYFQLPQHCHHFTKQIFFSQLSLVDPTKINLANNDNCCLILKKSVALALTCCFDFACYMLFRLSSMVNIVYFILSKHCSL